MRTEPVALVALALAAGAGAAEPHAYGGIGLAATLPALRAQFPASKIDGDSLVVADRDSRDHIYSVQLIGR